MTLSILKRSVGVSLNGRRRVVAIALFALAAYAFATLPAGAADRTAEVVAAMRERGWDDTAVEFLNWIEKSPLATDEFRAELPFHRAQSLAAQSRQANRQDQRRLASQAADEFQRFAAAHPDSPRALESLKQAASLHAELGIADSNEAYALPSQADAQRATLLASARKSLEAAVAAAEQLVAECDEQLDAMPKAALIQSDETAKAKLADLRARRADAAFTLAILAFETARTHPADSKEFAAGLDDASEQFENIKKEYGARTLVYAASRFYQGRCAQEQGDFKKALACYGDLLKEPTTDAAFRQWAARAQRYSAECLLAVDKVDEAIESASRWLASSRPAEREQPEWLEVAFRLAAAKGTKIKSLEPGDSKAKRLEAEVRAALREVAERPNEFQNEARLALASLNQRDGKSSSASKPGGDYKDFDEAFEAGKSALEVMNSSAAAAKLARQNNPDAVEDLTAQAKASEADALTALETAVELATRKTPIADLNKARYFLCWLYWQDGRTFDTAVLGEYLARTYPDAEFAKAAAQFSLAAFEKLADEARAAAPGAGQSFESKKLAEVAELIASRWPDTPEGATAVNILIAGALRDDRIAEAEELLARLPEGSRAAAQLNLGAGLWTLYLRSTSGRDEPPSDAAIARRDKAGALLTAGFAGLPKDSPPTFQSASAALHLVQYLLARGDAAGALQVLEAPGVGPLTLVKEKNDTVSRPEYIQETYKAALRTYLSTEPPQRDQAKKMMTALEKSVEHAGGAEAEKQLTRIYVSLGLQLQRQVKELTAAGENKKAQAVAAAFDDVLQRVAGRPGANGFAIRSWIAQTNLQIGQGLASEDAKPYLQRAQQGFEAILEAAKADKKYAPSDVALLGVQMRLGECLIALGQYAAGIDQYAAILKAKPNALDWQLAAVAALKQWGIQAKDPTVLNRALKGDKPQSGGQNLIWGWVRLGNMADMARRQEIQRSSASGQPTPEAQQRIDRYEDLFFEARYNIVYCRYMAGLFIAKADRRPHMETAKKNIETMKTLYPGLGGPKWKPEFDALLAKIDQELAKL